MVWWNLVGAWTGMAFGVIAGAAIGLGFGRTEFLGGYPSWARRLVRLGHISFFGLAFVNLALVGTALTCGLGLRETLTGGWRIASISFLVGAASMPLVCFASAWRPAARHLFFIPVVSVFVGILSVIQGVTSL